ncbi:MAG: CvpA family protein [Pseudomonadales bacterium]|jgi:membrane protein required for colicin V production
MMTVDWIIVGLIGFSALIGAYRGFVKEAMSLVGWFASLVLAMTFADQLAPLFTGIEAASVQYLAAFGAIFVLSLVAVALINGVLSLLIEATGLSGTDRVLGAVFGLGRGLIVILAAVVFLPGLVPVDQDGWWQTSVLIPEFQQFEGWARDIFQQFYSWLQSLMGRS